MPMLPDATKPETAVAPTFQPPLPLSPAAQWKIPLGMEWHDKAGRAKSPVWDYFRIEVPLGTEQHPVSEIVCVHASHAGERVVVKAPSNTSNLRKHLSNMHGIFLEGVRGASQAVPVADALPPPADATLSPAADAAPAARKRPHTQRAKHPRTVSMRPADTPPCGVDATHGQRPPLARTGQVHEDDSAAVVVVCEPALSKTMGALHPAGALYARPVHISEARAAHAAFVALLRRRGVETHDVRDLLARDADWNVGDRCRLEDLAAKALTYKMAADASAATADPHAHEQHRHYVSDEYKRSVLKEMDVSQLVDIVMTTPTVTITDTGRDTGYLAQYTFSPSTNIMFCRDQQVTTAAGGVVMARLQSKQRAKEGDILEFCLRKLGANVLGRVERGFLEGGDFFPCGLEMCFIGIGPRSTYPAVHWMMEMNVLGTQDVVVVRDELDMSQDRMHLDCVFNIVRCPLFFHPSEVLPPVSLVFSPFSCFSSSSCGPCFAC